MLAIVLFAAAWPAPQQDPDLYAFARRATLDLAGRLPTPDELRAFARSRDRDRLVAALLDSPAASRYHADLWMQWLLDWDFVNSDFHRFKASELHEWLRASFDRPLEETVRALLRREGPAANFARKHLEGAEPPVKLALLNARLFLGRDLRCAQCHDHPSEKLSQEDFWGFAAFFGEGRGGIRDHLGEKRVPPRFLDGRVPAEGRPPLEALADFLDPRPALGARYSRLILGRDGVDVAVGAASPKELLRSLAARPGYRAARVPLRPLNPVQFMNAFADVFDLEAAHKLMEEKALKSDKVGAAFKDPEVLRLFFHKWARDMLLPRGADPESVASSGTVRLALKLMNNRKVAAYYSIGWGTLKQVLGRKSSPADRLEELFLSVIGRPPNPAEKEVFVVKNDWDYEDVFWALVNSAEFLLVH
jgi:hypothetical protein